MAHLKCQDHSQVAPVGIIPLDSECLVLGRDASCDLVLSDDAVSRRHAEIRLVEGRWRLRDLGSTNGTSVNHVPIAEAVLASGDRIRIGRSVFLFEEVRPPIVEGLPQAGHAARRRIGAGRALLAMGVVLLGILGGLTAWRLAGQSRGKVSPAPQAAPQPPSVQGGEPGAALVGRSEQREPSCDLSVHVTGQYDHSFDSPDQNWSLEESLELEAKGLALKAEGGTYRGQRQTGTGSDEVECVLAGSRVTRLRWRASRRMTRSMSDGRKVPAREETWTFEVENLPGAPGKKEALVCSWRPGAGPLPRLTHSITFYPQGATVALTKALWVAEGDEGKGGEGAVIRATLWR